MKEKKEFQQRRFIGILKNLKTNKEKENGKYIEWQRKIQFEIA